MDKKGSLLVLLLLFISVLGRSNALNSRKLVSTPDPNGSSNAIQGTPSSTSITDKKSNPPPVEPTKPNDSPNTNPSNAESKGLNDATTKTNSETSTDKKVDKEKSEDGKEKVEAEKTRLETFSNKSCNGNPVCIDQQKTMIACIQDFEIGSNNLTLVVQNEQDTDMKVNITSGTSINDNLPAFEIPSHVTKQVNFNFTGDKTSKLIINSGNGACELLIGQLNTTPVNGPPKVQEPETPPNPKDVIDPANTPIIPKVPIIPPKPKEIKEPPIPKTIDTPATSSKDIETTPATSDKTKTTDPVDDVPVSQNNFLDQLTFYSKQVTPMHGAYLAFFVALVIGGSWALCSFRKRRNDGGVAYQELEMGIPESSNAVDVETVEGWDQDWDDDDWDEDKAIRSPGGGGQLRTVSSDGLTSRGSKKDGWDADWDE